MGSAVWRHNWQGADQMVVRVNKVREQETQVWPLAGPKSSGSGFLVTGQP